MRKNKMVAVGLTLTMSIMALVGCGSSKSNRVSNDGGNTVNTEKYSIVCTTFPQYDWVREIIGNKAEQFQLTLLLDDGADLHSYQPTAEDITKIASADLFVYVGGESDGWVNDALREATNKEMKVVNMLEAIGDAAKEEELVEGMQGEEEHEHGEEAEEDHEHEEEGPEYDEHIWLSVKNASKLTEVLAQTIQEMDVANASEYENNAVSYINKLNELDAQYQETVTSGSNKAVLFGDRFPFRYLVDDYDLEYYAAFIGCSAETEASFETITFLANKVDELGLSSILVLENSNQRIAETIKQNTNDKNQEILVMDSLQSITKDELEGDTTYYSVMEKNLEVLKKALH